MVADFHSFISTGPEMKAGGVRKSTGQQAPGYQKDAAELMHSKRAVCMWLTPWLTASLQHPQTSPVN